MFSKSCKVCLLAIKFSLTQITPTAGVHCDKKIIMKREGYKNGLEVSRESRELLFSFQGDGKTF